MEAFSDGVFAVAISFTLIFLHAMRAGLLTTAPQPEERRLAVLRFGLGTVAYLVVMMVSLVSPAATLVGAGLLAGYYVFQRSLDSPGDEPGI